MRRPPNADTSDASLLAIVATLAAMALVVFAIALVVAGCASAQVGPFVPPHPRACRADPDCPDHYACRYPSASWPGPICMRAESDVYAWSPSSD